MIDAALLFDPADLLQWLVHFLLPFFRIAAFLTAVPVFGNQLVSLRIRLIIALSAAILVFPILPVLPVIDPLSLAMLFLIVEQLLIGFGLGFLVQIFFHVLRHTRKFVKIFIKLVHIVVLFLRQTWRMQKFQDITLLCLTSSLKFSHL